MNFLKSKMINAGVALVNTVLRLIGSPFVATQSGFGFHNTYQMWVYGPTGELKGHASGINITVNVGLNDVLNQYFKGSAYTATFFVGLKGSGATAATDTMASHVGWTELTSYSQSTRPALTLGAVSAQSVDNSASKATFSVTAPMTVAGAFVTTNSTVGGSTGTLFGVADFQATGTVNTSGTAVTYVTGVQFSAAWAGQQITINSVNYTISSVTDATHLTLSSSAGVQSGVNYSTVNTKLPGNGDTIAVQVNLTAATA